MYTKIVPQFWMLVPKDIRVQIAKAFSLPRTGVSEIRDQEVISDGHSLDDLAHITWEKMEAYVGSKEPFHRLWELTIAKAKYELAPPISLDSIREKAEFDNRPKPVEETAKEDLLFKPKKDAKKSTKAK